MVLINRHRETMWALRQRRRTESAEEVNTASLRFFLILPHIAATGLSHALFPEITVRMLQQQQ